MLVKTGTLPQGVVINNQTYREYELREQLVADEVEVLESEDGPRAMKSDAFFNVCLIARRVAFKGMSGVLTPAMVMAMASDDFKHILMAGCVQNNERASFRDAAEAASGAATGPAEAGI